MSRTKCVVIREELVALTGDYKRAIVLGQLMYWSERVKDRNSFVEEEKRRYTYPEEREALTHGWFYKRAEDLSEETMMGVKPKAMREYVKCLVTEGWVSEQRRSKLDRTLHYRVNLVKIYQDLRELGYNLKSCTTHPFPAKGEKETPGKERIVAKSEKEGAVSPEPPSNVRKEQLATPEKENTQYPETVGTQEVQATNLPPEIKEQRLQDSEITHTDYEGAVYVRIMELFGKKLAKTKVRTLIDLAKREDVNLEQAIENTHAYHTQVERCRGLFGAIQYALQNGGWETKRLSQSSKPVKPLTKAVQKQMNRSPMDEEKMSSDPEIIAARKRLQARMKRLGYVYKEEWKECY